MKTIPLRHLAEINPPSGFFEALPAEADVLFLPLETVWADGRADQTRRVRKSSVESGYTRFHPGDTVCPKVTPTFQAGRSMRANAVGAGTTELHVLRPRVGVDPRWVTYAVRSKHFLEEGVTAFQGVAGLQRVPQEFVANFRVADVPMGEQRRIADFLDDRVARIDQIITARRQQIALLGESHDAALHEFVELASVGIPRRRLGAMATIGSGGFLPSTEFVDEGPVPVFGGNGFAGCFDRANTHADAIVVGRVGALCGNVHLIESPTWVTDNALVVELREPTLSSAYVAAVLADRNLNRIASQTAQPLITGTQVGDQQIPLLAEAEQAEVVKRWRLTGDVGQGATLRRSIALLTEYKQSLITAVVTGELDVTTAGSGIPG